jgi:hypothetical protein
MVVFDDYKTCSTGFADVVYDKKCDKLIGFWDHDSDESRYYFIDGCDYEVDYDNPNPCLCIFTSGEFMKLINKNIKIKCTYSDDKKIITIDIRDPTLQK